MLRLAAVSLLFIVGTFSIILFFLIASSPLPGLRKEENTAKFEIDALHQKMAKYFVLNDQLRRILAVLKERPSYDRLIYALQKNLPSGMKVTTLKMDDKTVSLTFSSANLSDFNGFLALASGLTEKEKIFGRVVIDSLTVDPENGQYVLIVALTK